MKKNAKKAGKAVKREPGLAEIAAKNRNRVMGYHVDGRGLLHIWNVPVLSEGVYPYLGRNIDPTGVFGINKCEVYAVRRTSSDIASRETMCTFCGVPVVDKLSHRLFASPRSKIVKPYGEINEKKLERDYEGDADYRKRTVAKMRQFGMDSSIFSKAIELGEFRSEKNRGCIEDVEHPNHVLGCAFNPHFMKGNRKILYVDMVIFDTVRYLFQIDMGVREVAACYSCTYAKDGRKGHEFRQKDIHGNSIAMVASSRNFHDKLPELTADERHTCRYIVPTKESVAEDMAGQAKKAEPVKKPVRKPSKKAKRK